MGRSYSQTVDGRILIRDEETGRLWRVTPDTIPLLEALDAGWGPGQPVPAALGHSGDPNGADLAEVVADLERQGLVGDPPPVTGSRLARGFVLGRVSVPRWARRWGRLVGPAAPFVAAGLLLVGAALLVAGGRDALQVVQRETRASVWLGVLAAALVLKLVLVIPHELGHAVPLAAATGEPVLVGFRVRGVVPQFYCEVHRVLTLPRRRDRVGVLLGGVSAELTGWALVLLGLAWAVPEAPRVLPPVLAAVAGAGAVVNLAPFRGTDGYWLLSELSDHRRLEQQARAAAHERLFRRPRRASRPAWLAWYGLADLYLAPLVILALAAAAGWATGRWGSALAVGGVLAAALTRGGEGKAREAHEEEKGA